MYTEQYKTSIKDGQMKKKEIFVHVYVSNKYWNQVGMNMLVENYSLLLC